MGNNLSILTTMQKVESSNAIANRSLKQCSNKKTEGVIKSPVFLFAAICSHLVQSWSGPKYMSKAKYKRFENREIHYNYFSITATSSFFKRPDFRACFILLACCMHLNKFSRKYINIVLLAFHYIWLGFHF